MEKEIKEASKSVQILYDALKQYNVTGLYEKVVVGNYNPFLVIMPEIANGDIESPYNIYIDVEEFGVDEKDGLLSGEFTLNFGFSHSHFTYGYVGGTVELISDDMAKAVQMIQNGEVYSFRYVNGLQMAGFREMLSGFKTPRESFEVEQIIQYYSNTYRKEGMPEIIEDVEIVKEIEEILKKSNSKVAFYRFNEEKPTEVELFKYE